MQVLDVICKDGLEGKVVRVELGTYALSLNSKVYGLVKRTFREPDF